jgi:hypothetical protein
MKLYYDNIIFSLQKVGGVSTYFYELLKHVLADSSFDLHVIENKIQTKIGSEMN